MAFIIGIYWCADPVELETERIRIRDCSVDSGVALVVLLDEGLDGSFGLEISPP